MICILPALEHEIFVNLTKAADQNGHFKVYNRETLLERWHANNPQRMGPILAVADDGYAFQDLWDEARKCEEEYNVTSDHMTKRTISAESK